jgi:DNA-directed RNA polymerase specialized sigma subunit
MEEFEVKEFYIKTKEGNIPVNEDVYYAYYRQKWHERYEYKKRLDKELSYEGLCESGVSVDFKMTATERFVEDEVITKIMVEKLRRCLLQLSDEELFLVTELFFKERTVREISEILSIPKSTIQRQKDKILKRLFIFLNKVE